MTEKVFYWASVVFGFFAVLLFIGNATLITGNRALQEEVSRRQSMISNTGNISNLNQGLAQALAQIAVKEKDEKVRDLLAAQGITVRENAEAPKSEAAKPELQKKK